MWQMAFVHRWPGQPPHPVPLCHAPGHSPSSKRGITATRWTGARPRTALTEEGTLCQFWKLASNGRETGACCHVTAMPENPGRATQPSSAPRRWERTTKYYHPPLSYGIVYYIVINQEMNVSI